MYGQPKYLGNMLKNKAVRAFATNFGAKICKITQNIPLSDNRFIVLL